MKKLNVCPSTLQKGYDTYSPAARKALFDGREVSHIFAGPSPDADSPEALDAIRTVHSETPAHRLSHHQSGVLRGQ